MTNLSKCPLWLQVFLLIAATLILLLMGVDARAQYGGSQVGSRTCQGFRNARCVKKERCGAGLEDQLVIEDDDIPDIPIYEDIGTRSEEDYNDEEVVPQEGLCDSKRDEICCPQEKIKPEPVDEPESPGTCSDHASEGFQCIPNHQCFSPSEIMEGSLCQRDLEVCCKKIDPPEETNLVGVDVKMTKKFKPQCGRRNRPGIYGNVDNRAADPSYSQFTEWPHMCALYECNDFPCAKPEQPGNPEVGFLLGGASLIAPNILLTAAHTVEGADLEGTKVRCGDWDRISEQEPAPFRDRLIKRISIHPLYNSNGAYHDVAIIYLKKPFTLAHHIDTICLPQFVNDDQYDPTECYATGWGGDKFNPDDDGSNYQTLLKQVKLPIVDNTECQEIYRNHPNANFSEKWKLHDSFLCAGGEPDQDLCQGDGGGPLMCKDTSGQGNDDRYVQVGITSWGKDCGTRGLPGVYASVPADLCFIISDLKCNDATDRHFDEYFGSIDEGGYCDNWSGEEYEKTKAPVEKLRKYLDRPDITAAQKEGLQNRIDYLETAIKKILDHISRCSSTGIAPKSGSDDYNE